METRKRKLESELAKIAEMEKESKQLRTFESFTDKEKIEYFRKVYAFAKKIMDEKLGEDWCEDNDNDHYAFELVMEIFGKDIWKLYNGSD